MLTQEQNERLTRVGPRTPAGELLRRYWHPVAVAQELSEERPTQFVRILGEDLVLFRDKRGRVGLLADHCPHRGASLLYGRVEERGISCAYHGWLMDTEGNVLETPPERNDAICRNVKTRAYPVQRLAGLYWAYLGPLPAPALPKYDVFARTDGKRRITVHHMLDCNWFQTMENATDPTHAPILHQDIEGRTAKPVNTTRGFIDDQPSFDFWRVPYGIMKRRNFANGESDEHPLIFPNMLRTGGTVQIRVPVDDTHTWRVDVNFKPDAKVRAVPTEEQPPVVYNPPHKNPPDALYPFARFEMRTVSQQDHMAWESQGQIADRTVENLSFSDRAIIELRRMALENIEKVERGEDPLAVVRDPEHPVIDTNLDHDLQATGGKTGRGRPYGITTGTLEV
jgi:5,5'-dehydrodivanillate O-demethylase